MSEAFTENSNNPYEEMAMHINKVLEIIEINEVGEHLIGDVSKIKNQINNKKINLNDVKKVSNDIYSLNLNSDFTEITDRISNEYYAFEYILQKFLEGEIKNNGRKG